MLKKGVIVAVLIIIVVLVIVAVVFKLSAQKELSAEERGLKESKMVLGSFLKGVLLKEHLPDVLDVKYKLASSGELNGTNYTYAALWERSGVNFHANVHYDEGLTSIGDYSVKLYVTNPPQGYDYTSMEFAKLYFKYFPGEWKCRQVGNGNITITLCESFSVKEGYTEGVAILSSPGTSQIGGVACHLNTLSRYYSSESCIQI